MELILQDLFLDMVNMSITASYVILFVLIARLFLKKTPKVFSYSLWALVLFRLICPFSFSSAFSFLQAVSLNTGKMEYISSDIGMMAQPQINTGINGMNEVINSSLPAATPYASANPMQIILFIISVIWALGIISLLLYSIISYLMLKRKVRTAMLVKDNVFECEDIASPFILGIINPKIYLPIGLKDTERKYILMHEKIHIRRFDYLAKPFAFLVLCVHWFNPLVWLSFVLMSKDMEMSCDERVLKELGPDIKKDYSASLLSLAVSRRMISSSPLAFGESNAKARIKNVLRYKQPTFWIIAVALIAVVCIGAGLMSNPKDILKFAYSEKTEMATAWAEALKTRDGKPRYEMMSQALKEKFIAEQKQRAGNDEWNYNIWGSSPHVIDYKITINADSADIIYHMEDSGKERYDKYETISFGKENNKTIVTDVKDLLSEWERVNYFAPTAELAMQVYKKALLESDYLTLLSLMHSEKFDSYGQQNWVTIKIDGVKVIKEDVRDKKACYELELHIKDGGNSAFETGISPRWLWLVKDEQGWYADGLMTSGWPDEVWWNKTATENEPVQ